MLLKNLHRIKVWFISGLIFLICFAASPAKAQYFDLNKNRKSVSMRFKLIRNLVIVQLKINDKGPFNFILDTGVGLMIMTNPKMVDSLDLVSKRTIKIVGLGEGDAYEAYVTPPLKIEFPGLTSYDVAATILKTDHFNLSNFLGIPVSGLLGYEFFNNLAVKLNFIDSTLTVYRPHDTRLFRSGTKIPITIEVHKPYVQTLIAMPNGTIQQCKMIIDLGAGHPVSLENMIKKHGLPQNFIAANLGVGLGGPISGFLSRIDEIDIGKFRLKKVITSFPNDYDTTTLKYMTVARDGNIGLGVLKRFTVVFNYQESVMYLKPNSTFRDPFEHDMSGIEYYAAGDDFKHIIVSRVEPGSPADEIGLEKDDEITSINFKPVADMSLEEIDGILKSKSDRSLLLEIYHDHKYDRVIMTLRRRI
ncbi:MAG TPA: aspartyl protease family protein [Mucilaginibacter sp.]|nr:aspartyl protease family protein [Mucilaginibacter sp.]